MPIFEIKLNSIKKIFFNQKVIIGVYILATVLSSAKQYFTNSLNNYLIFKYTFWHTLQLKNLYLEYPAQYFDSNHYGPFFAVVIAPFAILPNWLGLFLWNSFNTGLFLYAIFKMPLTEKVKIIIAWLSFHEFLTAILSSQFNVAITGLILLTFIYLEKQKVFAAAITMLVGFFVKLYGIVGLAFFFFIQNKNKLKFVYYSILIGLVFVCLPSLFSNFTFAFNSYSDWYNSLIYKSSLNETSLMADISLFGFFRRATGIHIPVLYGTMFAAIVLAIILTKKSLHSIFNYRLLILCYLLLCIVLFNTNVESPTYVIAFTGVAIWFTMVKKNYYTIALFVFAFILTSLSPSDLFPRFLNEQYVRPYALKALPCIFIWMDVAFRLLFFKKYNNTLNLL
jgi:hypothetical protein